MKTSLKKIFEAITNGGDFEITQSEWQNQFPNLFSIFLNNGFIKESTKDTFATCPRCSASHETYFQDGVFIMNCDDPEYSGLEVIKREDVIKYRFNLKKFAQWLNKELSLDDIPKVLDSETWFLGSSKNQGEKENYYLALSEEYNSALNILQSFNSLNPIVFYLGTSLTTPHQAKRVVSLNELLSLTDREMLFDKTYIKGQLTKIFVPNENSLDLDRDIKISFEGGSYKLLLGSNVGGTFRGANSIPPMAFYIVEHLYNIRKYSSNALTAKEMQKKNIGGSKHARKITENIKKVNDLCKKANVKIPIIRMPGNKYQLNPSLDCFTETSPSPSPFNTVKVK